MFNRTDRLYWVDSLLDQIGHISVEGTDRQTFTNIGQITQPYSLTVYSGDLTEHMHYCTHFSSAYVHVFYTLDKYR